MPTAISRPSESFTSDFILPGQTIAKYCRIYHLTARHSADPLHSFCTSFELRLNRVNPASSKSVRKLNRDAKLDAERSRCSVPIVHGFHCSPEHLARPPRDDSSGIIPKEINHLSNRNQRSTKENTYGKPVRTR